MKTRARWLAGAGRLPHHFPMQSLGIAESVAALFVVASLILMLCVPDAVAKARDGKSTHKDWIPVVAATVVLLTVAIFAK